MSNRYFDCYRRWQQDPHDFWREAAEAIQWIKPPQKIFDSEAGVYGHWFPDATCNTCWNTVDRHVAAGRGMQTAIIYDSPLTATKAKISYAELLDEVATLAAVLQEHGISKGDRVVIYMPMIPQAVFAMLACARIGAIHSVVFGGFAAKELAKRLDDAGPRLVLAASCGIEPGRVIHYKPLIDDAINMVDVKPQACLIWQRPQAEAKLLAGRDFDWADAVAKFKSEGRTATCVEVAATDPLYILYTSGTTGIPKGVVRDNGGHMVALSWTMSHFYDIAPGECFWTASDIGWVVGHSYIVYGPLLRGATTILYEGKAVGTPDAGAFWRVIAEHRVVSLFTAPTAFRAIRREDSEAAHLHKYDVSSLRALFLAGERADPNTVQWAEKVLKIPIIDHWWQTETGWCIAGNPVGLGVLPVKHGSASVAMPGYDVAIVDEGAKPAPQGCMGSIVVKLPLPPGALPTLWQRDAHMKETYLTEFPGYYKTSDAGFIDGDGYLFVMGRTDDIINVAGHRLSTGGMEEILAAHPDVAECAVIGIKDELKGECPCGFVVLKAGVSREPACIEEEIVQSVRDSIGAVAAFKLAIVVKRLPKTRSGKILRGTMKKIIDHENWSMPATIEDPTVLEEIANTLELRRIKMLEA